MGFHRSFSMVRLSAVWGVRSAPHTAGAVVVLILWLIFPGLIAAHAAQPERDCAVSVSGKRICLSAASSFDVVSYSSENNEPHPATVSGSSPVRVGRVVEPLPIDRFLPHYFYQRVYTGGRRDADDSK